MAFSANSFRTSTLLISKDTDHSPLPFFFSICTFSCTVVTHLEHLSSSSTRFKLLSNRRNLKKEGHKRKPFLLKLSFFHRINLKQEEKKKREEERTKKGIDDERENLVARDSSANTSISFIITTSHPLELHDDQALSHIFSCLLSFYSFFSTIFFFVLFLFRP